MARTFCSAAVLVITLSGNAAWAQAVSNATPSSETDDAKRIGELLKKGAEAYRKRQHAKALESLETAWRLKKSPVIASMLAEVEMNLEQYDAAAQHWAYALGNFRVASKDALKEAAAGLEECKKHLGTLQVSLTPPDALLFIDERAVDVQSTGMETWVLPGRHRVYAVHAGGSNHPDVSEIEVRAGEMLKINVSALASAPVVLSSVVLGPVGTVTPASGGGSGIENRTVVAIVGGGLTLAAVGAGGLFALKRSNAYDRLDGISAELHRISEENDGEMVCRRSTPPAECAEFARTYAEATRATDRANIAFGVAAGIGVATVATYLLWPKARRAGSTDIARASEGFVVSPWLSRDSTGLGIQGAF